MATAATKATPAPALKLDAIQVERIRVPIVGTAPLIVHAWSAKAKQEMLDKQQGRKAAKPFRDPDADYEASLYRINDGRFGFPLLAFKAATVSSARFFGKSVRMTEIRQFLFMQGGLLGTDGKTFLIPIEGKPDMRDDMVRIGMTTDIRFRAEFKEWRAALDVTYVKSTLTKESVIALIDAGGFGVGVGEWRPEKSGQNGTYTIDPDRNIETIR